MTDALVASRLRTLREFHGLTLSELAARSEVSASTLSRIERGEREISSEVERLLSSALDVGNVAAFDRTWHSALTRDSCHFRNVQRMPARVREQARAHAELLNELVSFVGANVTLPRVRVPSLRATSLDDAERAADHLRFSLGLGLESPLANVTNVVEQIGVAVFVTLMDPKTVDAFSFRLRQRPVAILSLKESASRNCFSLAHELGHLVMHDGKVTGDEESERHADRFASAFLMPRTGFSREFPRTLELDAFLRMKARWRVSVAAMIRRGHDLGLVSPVQYRNLYKRLSHRRWTTSEPGEFEFFAPRMMERALNALNDAGTSPSDVASALGWSVPFLERIIQPIQLPVESRPLAPVIRLHPR